ncbi:MAG: small ribosomal subunit Rsm22 family protein [Treponema sp.]|nr:small ribosomal subunit Rsm22 family protein [Treponema sp.]
MALFQILDAIPELIKKTFPIPGRFKNALPLNIAKLSRLLTNNRGERTLSYLSRPEMLSAYLYYFLPWNLYRLCFLLPCLDLKLKPGDIVTDLGSGPLSFVSALWISRPELRNLPLEINCIDRCSPALDAGKNFFNALAGENNWKINLIRDDIDIRKTGKGKKASLVSAVNLFNEIYEKIPHNNTEKLKQFADNSAEFLHNTALQEAFIFTAEPGVPQSGRFISFLRDAFLKMERMPFSPCTHTESCPLAGNSGQKRWCHFAFETENVSNELQRLSAAAGLPKERLVISYLLTGKKTENTQSRVISDAFPLSSGLFGRYCCCADGLVLLTGVKNQITKIKPHSTVKINLNGNIDKKSGALTGELK